MGTPKTKYGGDAFPSSPWSWRPFC